MHKSFRFLIPLLSITALTLSTIVLPASAASSQSSTRKEALRNAILERLQERRNALTDRKARKPIAKPSPKPSRPSRPDKSSTPSAPVSGNLSAIRSRIIELVNQERTKQGLPSLENESHLQSAAQKHAEDMANRKYFEHNTPEGVTPTNQIRNAGYPMNGAWSTGQNIARGQMTAEEVMKGWMNSPGHRKNILSKSFEDIGVGYYQNHWVQDFGSHN